MTGVAFYDVEIIHTATSALFFLLEVSHLKGVSQVKPSFHVKNDKGISGRGNSKGKSPEAGRIWHVWGTERWLVRVMHGEEKEE